MRLFGRKISASAGIRLGGLALAALLLIFLVVAPMTTMTITVKLPSRNAAPRLPTSSDWLSLGVFVLSASAIVAIVVGLFVWIAMTARRIIAGQPKAPR